AALVEGFANHDPGVRVTGVIFNNVGSDRHANILKRVMAQSPIPVLAYLLRDPRLVHPSRHLGLAQAFERSDLEDFLNTAADALAQTLDQLALIDLFAALPMPAHPSNMPPPAQVIAMAQDTAFAFSYPHLLRDWRNAGAEIHLFSPLANEAAPKADLIFLPGGYPELHAGRLAAAERFLSSLRIAAVNTDIYGECGGYMVLGDGLVDGEGNSHAMAGLLRLETSFEQRKLHLGYRDVTPLGGVFDTPLKAHEFHYASTLTAEGDALFAARDAEGTELPPMGLRLGRVSGSFAHVIDLAN
ncbi:MAG: cobyrinate a,c-diamide synthase, partial [Pseudomonadota bacterium]